MDINELMEEHGLSREEASEVIRSWKAADLVPQTLLQLFLYLLLFPVEF